MDPSTEPDDVAHEAQHAPSGPSPVSTPVPEGTTGTRVQARLSDVRVAGRRATSRAVDVAVATTGGATVLARALGVSPSAVRRWSDQLDPLPVALGDVLAAAWAGRPGFARAVLGAVLALVDAASPASGAGLGVDRLVRQLSAATGRINGLADEALADGELDEHELLRLLREAQELVALGNRTCTNLRTRLDRLAGPR